MESMESVSQALSNRDFSRDKAYGRANTPIMGVVVTRTVETVGPRSSSKAELDSDRDCLGL